MKHFIFIYILYILYFYNIIYNIYYIIYNIYSIYYIIIYIYSIYYIIIYIYIYCILYMVQICVAAQGKEVMPFVTKLADSHLQAATGFLPENRWKVE